MIKKTSKMHRLNSHTKISSKDKESTRSSQDIASSWVSTEAYPTVVIDDKTIKYEFKMMRKSQNMILEKQGGNYNEKSK